MLEGSHGSLTIGYLGKILEPELVSFQFRIFVANFKVQRHTLIRRLFFITMVLLTEASRGAISEQKRPGSMTVGAKIGAPKVKMPFAY